MSRKLSLLLQDERADDLLESYMVMYSEHLEHDHGEPPNYRAALSDPESEKWLEAMNVKMQSMKDNQVWNLVDLPPNWFANPKHPRRVCKLQRSIYELKQASRGWNKRFDKEIKKYGFTQNPDKPCLYKRASGRIIVFLILYVDDILLMGNNILMLQDVKSWLGKCFAIKDLDLSKSQGPSTPAEVKRMKGIPYASVLGSIMYAVRCTRPDVAFSQNLTNMFLVYGGDSTTKLSVTCYTDASWETDRDDLRSQTGFVSVMNGGTVDWKSSKQSTTAMFSMEAEYIAAAEAAMKAILIRKFIYGLGVIPNIDKPMDMYCDNTGTITIVDESGVQKDNNLADPFTKPMPCTKHVEHARSIGLRPAGSFM
ncbi:retrotransposon protein, putative, ty1-copia subclass [Tanacetum coccineum]